jgi:UDP-3-O-[3-hydroxymyristoyl] glucosamine N-acyltransferase
MFAVAATVVTNTLRTAGRALDKAGRLLEVNPYVESALPSTRIMPYKKNIPNVEGVAFIAPSATVMGRVTLGQGSSVWYGAVIRGK